MKSSSSPKGISRASLASKLELREGQVAALRREVRMLRGAKEKADQRLVTIKALTRQLAAEHRLNNALSKLEWVPSKQSKARIDELREALAVRNEAMRARAA